MAILRFDQIQKEDVSVGGKAWGLAHLTQLGFRVPQGLIVKDHMAVEDWSYLCDWWLSIGQPPLAVRSSAAAEDSKQNSFAGQNKSFLNVRTPEDLRQAIDMCFASSGREASQAYREFFQKNSQGGVPQGMNVVVQTMVAAQFSGVFFSEDPRSPGTGWVLEVVPGFGEKLVSGKVTPGQVTASGKTQGLPPGFTVEQAQQMANVGLAIAQALGYPVDIEWAIDSNGELLILQSRPITTVRHSSKQWIQSELERLIKNYSLDTAWDGQTFSEWSGFPSYFTFSLWKNAFSPHNAFGNVLKELGYESFSDAPYSPKDSLLERVFGRAYINLDRLSDLHYGPIPYRIVFNPRPHTEFDWSRLNWTVIKHAPLAIRSMLRVSWNLSVKRKAWLNSCGAELNQFYKKVSYPLELRTYKGRTEKDLHDFVVGESWRFSKEYLHWPLLLVVLLESTMQRLHVLLKGLVSDAEAQKLLRDWMARGLHTITGTMREAYQEALSQPAKRAEFMAKFGHRGPGEMDLANPRWQEITEQAFGTVMTRRNDQTRSKTSVEDEIRQFDTFKREVILEEWNFLKRILELRELWKMELLKPYAAIRYALNELGVRWQLGEDIHWLRLSEIEKLGPKATIGDDVIVKIRERRERFAAFRDFHFPALLTLRELQGIISGENEQKNKKSFEGEALSSGIVKGEVRVVRSYQDAHVENWPEHTILVAETTDPGWTPLFVKSIGLIVQKGGVLSHCAIVAREMGIPAVSGIVGCQQIFKDGDVVWVDGNLGRVYLEL